MQVATPRRKRPMRLGRADVEKDAADVLQLAAPYGPGVVTTEQASNERMRLRGILQNGEIAGTLSCGDSPEVNRTARW